MKFAGIVLMVLGAWMAYQWRSDPVEGAVVRPVAWMGAAVGVFLYFEGLKREIISALKRRKRPLRLPKRERDRLKRQRDRLEAAERAGEEP